MECYDVPSYSSVVIRVGIEPRHPASSPVFAVALQHQWIVARHDVPWRTRKPLRRPTGANDGQATRHNAPPDQTN